MSAGDSHSVVISVVYDGPPRAGKTTSVRSLARGFGREVYTPEERDGRTVFFDWLEHIGGRFEGAPIRCQIVSVPGQQRWTRRRGHFLDRADVVVFVGDTSAGGWAETVTRLTALRAQLDTRTGPPVGLVFQANKRDSVDAVPLDEVKARAASARTAVVESIASDGTGVREAFVFAVRLALDRVREEVAQAGGTLRVGFGDVGPELVARMRGEDAGGLPFEGELSTPEVHRRGPRPPTHDAPSGFVWPPIEGRILLREAAPTPSDGVRIAANGDWFAGTSSAWHVHSAARAEFTDLDEGRAALIAWARQHAMASGVLSRRRCIVLADSGGQTWRLWQIVQHEPTLVDLASRIEPAMAQRLLEEMAASCAKAALTLACSPDTVGLTELERPIYVGLMPAPPLGEAA